MKCPQCGSDECGPMRCRFTMVKHIVFRTLFNPRPLDSTDAQRFSSPPTSGTRCDQGGRGPLT